MNSSRSAFTLMEMLVVVALLATLAGIGAAGMRAADNMAREQRTRATIAKINRFVMEKYASYQYRRVPGNTYEARLANLRTLQRAEMPDHKTEVNQTYSPLRLRRATARIHEDTSDVAPAELLYQIVMGMPEAEEAFNGLEIGDTDGNGLNEFLDGWGTPIYYVRWPAGFVESNGAITKLQNATDIDPYDPQQKDSSYAVFPLIFSCGPDRERGIVLGSGSTPNGSTQSGSPGGGNNSGDVTGDSSRYYDNITNHNL